MPRESKTAVNLYGILDNELQRLHELLKIQLSTPYVTDSYQQTYTSAHVNIMGQHVYSGPAATTYNRILVIQKLIIDSMLNHDEALQEKIAEFALTDVK
jgi:hypothetical protein